MLTDDSILPTIQLAITTAGTVAVAWIGVQQIRAKVRSEERARRYEAQIKRTENAANRMETVVGEITRATETHLKEQ